MRMETIALALAAAAIAAPALGDELNLPARKPGEWQMTMAIAGHNMVTDQCVDADTDKQMMQSSFAKAGEKCSSISESNNGGTIAIDATCSLGNGVTTKTHAVITGDFQSAYTVDAVTDMTGGPPQMPKHSEIKQNVSWLGACPAGMKPGDITVQGMPGMPPGFKINPALLQGMKPPG